jgi:hypothetical protein
MADPWQPLLLLHASPQRQVSPSGQRPPPFDKYANSAQRTTGRWHPPHGMKATGVASVKLARTCPRMKHIACRVVMRGNGQYGAATTGRHNAKVVG